MSVLFQFTASDYTIGTFKQFLSLFNNTWDEYFGKRKFEKVSDSNHINYMNTKHLWSNQSLKTPRLILLKDEYISAFITKNFHLFSTFVGPGWLNELGSWIT